MAVKTLTRINPPEGGGQAGWSELGFAFSYDPTRRKSRFIGEMPNHNYQIPNPSQHAAQAPALRVTEI